MSAYRTPLALGVAAALLTKNVRGAKGGVVLRYLYLFMVWYLEHDLYLGGGVKRLGMKVIYMSLQ